MKEVIQELNEVLAARGSMVIAKDGIPIVSQLRPGIDQDRLAALAATVLEELEKNLDAAGLEGFKQIQIKARHGKLILVEAGPTYLLVLLGARLEVGPGSIEIRSAANRVAKEARLAVSEG